MSHREPSPVLTLTGANVYTAGPAVPYDDEGAVSEDRIALVSATPLTRPAWVVNAMVAALDSEGMNVH